MPSAKRTRPLAIDLTGRLAEVLQRSRNLSPEDVDRELKRLVVSARETLRAAGMPEVTGPKSLTTLAPFIVAQRAQDFVDGLGSDVDDDLTAAVSVLIAVAVLHDANFAFDDAVEGRGDPNLARIRLMFAGMQLGGLDVFKAVIDNFVFRDAAIRRDQHESSVGYGGLGGRKSGGTKKRANAARDRSIHADYLERTVRNPGLTLSSWASLRSRRPPWNLGAKRLQAIVHEQRQKGA